MTLKRYDSYFLDVIECFQMFDDVFKCLDVIDSSGADVSFVGTVCGSVSFVVVIVAVMIVPLTVTSACVEMYCGIVFLATPVVWFTASPVGP